MKKYYKRAASLFTLTMLAGIAVLTAQSSLPHTTQWEVMNPRVLLLQANPMQPDSMITFEYGTDKKTSKNEYIEYDAVGCTVMEGYVYADGQRTRSEMTYSKDKFPTYRAAGMVAMGYDRMLNITMYEWESGGWSNASDMTFEYDASGLLTEYSIAGLMTYTVESKIDAQSRVIYEKATCTIAPGMDMIQTWIVEYSANGKLKSDTTKTDVMGQTTLAVTTYSYDAKDLLTETLTHSWNANNQESWSKQKNNYDGNDRVVRIDYYEGTNPASLTETSYGILYYGGGTGIEDPVETQGIASVQVYPNPTDGKLQVTSNELQVTGVEIFDVMGRSVYVVKTRHALSLQSPQQPTTLDISSLPAGVYFLRIQTENGIIMKKVVKQ